MRTPPFQMFKRSAVLAVVVPLGLSVGLSLGLALAPATAQAGPHGQNAKPDCAALYELYRTCHRYGAEAESTTSCLATARDVMGKALARQGGKNLQAGLALTELVCATGCEDAIAAQERATPQEFAEAFCN